MAKVHFNPPLQWENWCGWLLAIWLCISPGPLKFGDDITGTYVAVLTGIVLICTEMLTISPFRLWEEWINVGVGAQQQAIAFSRISYIGSAQNRGSIRTPCRQADVPIVLWQQYA